MADHGNELLEILLRECQAAAPQPWYPVDYVQQTGLARATIDAGLDRLRLAGLVRLSDWVQGKGQGYLLTPEGSEVLQNPRRMKHLRSDGAQPAPAQAPLRPDTAPMTTMERGEAIRNVLLEPGRPIITQILLLLNIFVYLVEMSLAILRKAPLNEFIMGKQPGILDTMGAVSRADLVEGEWWRLLSYAFLHGDLLHLIMNMYFLYTLGRFVETMFGSLRYLILYLISGLGGGVAVVLSGSAAVGASGALCGLLAAMIVWVVFNRHYLPPNWVSRWLNNLMITALLIVFISMMPRVSAAGHFGGALAGAIVAVPLVLNRWGQGIERWLGLAGTVAAPLVCIGLISWSITNKERDEVMLARAQKLLLKAQRICRLADKDFANPLLENDGKEMFQDADAVQQALREFAAVQEELKTAQARWQTLSFFEPSLVQAQPLGKDYLATWSAHFDLLTAILTRRTPPTREESRTFRNQDKKIEELTGDLLKSPLFAR